MVDYGWLNSGHLTLTRLLVRMGRCCVKMHYGAEPLEELLLLLLVIKRLAQKLAQNSHLKTRIISMVYS